MDYDSTDMVSLDEETRLEIDLNESVEIKNIQEESNLISYTENHFNTQVNEDLKKIRESLIKNIPSLNNDLDMHFISNSPVRMSPTNSFYGGDSLSNSEDENNSSSFHDFDTTNNKLLLSKNVIMCYKLEQQFDKYYENVNDNKFTNELDILTTYVKAQKNLYIQSKLATQRRLNSLMFPSLILTAFVSIIAPFIECMPWSGAIVSAINASIAFLISLNNYLKYESLIESYTQMATTYDKLETSLDLTNSKLLFLNTKTQKKKLIIGQIKSLEKRISEIKDGNKVFIPKEVKDVFPNCYHVNIFSLIRKIETQKQTLLLRFQDIRTEITFIMNKWNSKQSSVNDYDQIREKNRLTHLYDVKESLKKEINMYKNVYNKIDVVFIKEIKMAEKINIWSMCWFNSNEKIENENILDKYINIVDE
jgi:hypothetical protein